MEGEPRHQPVNPAASTLRAFLRDEDGAQLLEFAIVLPLMLLLFGVIVEGGRMMWSYQTVVSGVRDASRYLARVAPRDICTTGGSVAGYAAQLETIVTRASDGTSVLPDRVRVAGVSATLSCPAGTFRSNAAPLVTVSADVEVTFPFARLFGFAGGTRPDLVTSVSDQNRVYGS
jgi:Flp pilus assembly protein TadG